MSPSGTHFPLPISIHSLRVEGDQIPAHCPANIPISIHSLRVEGDILSARSIKDCIFQSTPSVWRETVAPDF